MHAQVRFYRGQKVSTLETKYPFWKLSFDYRDFQVAGGNKKAEVLVKGLVSLTTPRRSRGTHRTKKQNMRPNIKLSLFKLAVKQLLVLFNNVIEKFTLNASTFPNPPISVAEMETMSESFSSAVYAAIDGGVADRKKRDNMVLEVRDMLRIQADYVRSVCNGDAALLALSGFELSKMPEPINEVGVPGRLVASATDMSGVLLIRWGKTKGARMFRLEKASGDPAGGPVTWSEVTLTGRQSAEVSGLVPYAECFFRVIGVGITHEGMPSDIVMGRAA